MRGDFTARSHLTDFAVLYVLLYGAFGAASPFLPAYIEELGIPAELIDVVFGEGTAIRLISAPIAGRIAMSMLCLAALPIARSLSVNGQ
jgi:hypothetical protein